MFHLSNRTTRLVKSLTRTTVVRDKESEARETLPNPRNSYSEHWRERQRRKVKGDAKNVDVENRWREISKVWQPVQYDDDIFFSQSLVNLRPRRACQEVRETELGGSVDLLYTGLEQQQRSKSAVSAEQRLDRDMVVVSIWPGQYLTQRHSLTVLQLPENYQGRVQASLECLEVPQWYKQSSQHPLNILHTTTPPSATPSWRSPPAPTASSTPSCKSSSQWRLQQQRNEPTNQVRPVRSYASSYCGWRSIRSNSEAHNNLLVTNPSQRLAKTVISDSKE